MKSMEHYRYQARKLVTKTAEATVLVGLLAARSAFLCFRKYPSPEEASRACEEAALDEALQETFPASDPPSPSVAPKRD